MQIRAFGRTDVGRERDHNEDSLICNVELGFFAVCDGMGGHAAGEVASKLAIETLAGVLRAEGKNLAEVPEAERRERLARAMRGGVQMANLAVHNAGKSKARNRGGGTTCTALLVCEDIAAMAHVGDSRLYLLRKGAITQLSNDHTFVAEAIRRGVMTAEEADGHRASNLLTRAVGPQPEVHVDTLVFDLLPGDTLLLSSDGLHNHFVEEAELANLLGGELDGLPERLIGIANERGGRDNITAVVLRVSKAQSTEDELRASRVHEGLDALRHIAILSELTLPELMVVREALTSEEFPAGTEIVSEGEKSKAMYVIVSGSMEVRRGNKPLAFLDSGSHFGEMALLSNTPRSATVRSTTACLLLALHRDRLSHLLQEYPLIGVKFLWRLAQIQSLRLDDATMPISGEKMRTVRLELYPSPFARSER